MPPKKLQQQPKKQTSKFAQARLGQGPVVTAGTIQPIIHASMPPMTHPRANPGAPLFREAGPKKPITKQHPSPTVQFTPPAPIAPQVPQLSDGRNSFKIRVRNDAVPAPQSAPSTFISPLSAEGKSMIARDPTIEGSIIKSSVSEVPVEIPAHQPIIYI